MKVRSWIGEADTPLLTMALAALVTCVPLFAHLRRAGGNVTVLVAAGDRFCDRGRVPSNLALRKDSDGYDGQFYFRLALDPFTTRQTDFGIQLDAPAYRHQRILYPLLAWGLSLGGRPALVGHALLFINLVSLLCIGLLGGKMARQAGLHALWGLAFPLFPGLFLSVLRDLADPLAAAFLLGAFYHARLDRWRTAALLLTLAVLTRETALLAALAAVPLWLQRSISDRKPDARTLPFLLYPLCAYLAIQGILFLAWGAWPFQENGVQFSEPLCGFLQPLAMAREWSAPRRFMVYFELSFVACFLLAGLAGLASRGNPLHERTAFLLYAVAIACARWHDDWCFLRLQIPTHFLASILLLKGPWPARALLASATGIAFLAVVRFRAWGIPLF